MFLPFSPKMSTKAPWTRLAKLGYFYSSAVETTQEASTHVVKRTIGTDVATLLQVAVLADDGGDTTGGKTGSSGTNEDRKLLEEFSLLVGGLNTEEVREDTDDSEQLVSRVARISKGTSRNAADLPLHQTQEGCVERVSLLQLVRVLAQEQVSGINQVANDQTEDLSEVETGDHLLECLRVSSSRSTKSERLTCSFGLFDDSSMMMSYLVRAECQ